VYNVLTADTMHIQVLEYPDDLFCCSLPENPLFRSRSLCQETAMLVFQEVCNLWKVSSEPWFVTCHQRGAISQLASGFATVFGYSGL